MFEQEDTCNKENLIRQFLKVQANVSVTPLVKHGIPKVHCIESSIKPNHDCNYTITQIICVEIPISFDVNVDVKKGISCCAKPKLKASDNTKNNNSMYILAHLTRQI